MDQIVYFSFPAAGHVNPTLPVMQELTRHSEHVIYFSTERFAAGVRATGADYRPHSPLFTMPECGPGPFARVSTSLGLPPSVLR